MRILLTFVLAGALTTRVSGGQVSDSAHRASGATVSGVVRDSIAHTTLADATVQLVAADSLPRFGRTAISDAQGRFTIADVPDGTYTLGFFHPLLDSLGLEAPLRAVAVVDQQPVQADLAVPSPARLNEVICGSRAANAGSVLVGIVRDARDGSPVVGASVLGEWLELTYKSRAVTPRIPGVEVKSGNTGWFALCGLPKAGTIALRANRGADSTGQLEMDVPGDRFLRRDLYIGAGKPVASSDSEARRDMSSASRESVRGGDELLTGTVVTIVDGKPVAGAQISILGGPRTRSNARGEWTIVDAPAGTRMLEVRAVGYYPDRRPVDITSAAPALRTKLFTLRAMLDTVKVVASRVLRRKDTGFEERMRSGAGHYMTAADVARHGSFRTSELFNYVPNLRVERINPLERGLQMRGGNQRDGWCQPEVYVNGHYMDHLSADEIDAWAIPKEIVGIEVYSETTVPVQFHRSMAECGAVVVWTKGW